MAIVWAGSTALLKVKITGADGETPLATSKGSLVIDWAQAPGRPWTAPLSTVPLSTVPLRSAHWNQTPAPKAIDVTSLAFGPGCAGLVGLAGSVTGGWAAASARDAARAGPPELHACDGTGLPGGLAVRARCRPPPGARPAPQPPYP